MTTGLATEADLEEMTEPGHRGRGLAGRLVRAVAHGIQERGEIPLMHAAATNVNAIRLYETLGFLVRRRIGFFAVQAPSPAHPVR